MSFWSDGVYEYNFFENDAGELLNSREHLLPI